MQPENTTPTQPLTNQVQPSPTSPQATEQSPYNQPPVKRSKKKLTMIIVAVFVVLITIGGIVAFTSTSKSVKTANEFTAALTTKDFDTAYNFFSPELKQEQTLEQFKGIFEPAPFDSSCVLKIQTREASTSTSTGSSKKLTGSIQCGNTSYPTELTFITSNGSEKLLSYSVKAANN